MSAAGRYLLPHAICLPQVVHVCIGISSHRMPSHANPVTPVILDASVATTVAILESGGVVLDEDVDDGAEE